jgi:hypothetical protein
VSALTSLIVLLPPSQFDESLDGQREEHEADRSEVGEDESSEHELLHGLGEVVDVGSDFNPDVGEEEGANQLDEDDEDDGDYKHPVADVVENSDGCVAAVGFLHRLLLLFAFHLQLLPC